MKYTIENYNKNRHNQLIDYHELLMAESRNFFS